MCGLSFADAIDVHTRALPDQGSGCEAVHRFVSLLNAEQTIASSHRLRIRTRYVPHDLWRTLRAYWCVALAPGAAAFHAPSGRFWLNETEIRPLVDIREGAC